MRERRKKVNRYIGFSRDFDEWESLRVVDIEGSCVGMLRVVVEYAVFYCLEKYGDNCVDKEKGGENQFEGEGGCFFLFHAATRRDTYKSCLDQKS